MKRLTKHLLLQLHNRYPEEDNLRMRRYLWQVAVANPTGSVAVKICRSCFHGDTNPIIDERECNGEMVYAIFREGRAVTLFFRRIEQPAVPSLMRVDRVIC